MKIFMGVVGVFLVYFGMLIIVRKKNCKIEVQGIFVDSVYIKSQYNPIFQYVYENNQYRNQSFESFPKRKIKKFISGQKYTIYVHDKKPKYFVLDRKLRYGEFLMIGVGLIFVVTSLLWNIGIIGR